MSKVDITKRLNNLVHISRTIDEEWIEWAHADMMEAKGEIERLRLALSIIAHDGCELSQDKILEQRNFFLKTAKTALS